MFQDKIAPPEPKPVKPEEKNLAPHKQATRERWTPYTVKDSEGNSIVLNVPSGFLPMRDLDPVHKQQGAVAAFENAAKEQVVVVRSEPNRGQRIEDYSREGISLFLARTPETLNEREAVLGPASKFSAARVWVAIESGGNEPAVMNRLVIDAGERFFTVDIVAPRSGRNATNLEVFHRKCDSIFQSLELKR